MPITQDIEDVERLYKRIENAPDRSANKIQKSA